MNSAERQCACADDGGKEGGSGMTQTLGRCKAGTETARETGAAARPATGHNNFAFCLRKRSGEERQCRAGRGSRRITRATTGTLFRVIRAAREGRRGPHSSQEAAAAALRAFFRRLMRAFNFCRRSMRMRRCLLLLFAIKLHCQFGKGENPGQVIHNVTGNLVAPATFASSFWPASCRKPAIDQPRVCVRQNAEMEFRRGD